MKTSDECYFREAGNLKRNREMTLTRVQLEVGVASLWSGFGQVKVTSHGSLTPALIAPYCNLNAPGSFALGPPRARSGFPAAVSATDSFPVVRVLHHPDENRLVTVVNGAVDGAGRALRLR